MKDEDLTGGQWRSTGSWWPGKKFSCQSGLSITLFSFFFSKERGKTKQKPSNAKICPHQEVPISEGKRQSLRKRHWLCMGEGFCASDRTSTTTGSPAGPQSNQNVWVLPPISRNAVRARNSLVKKYAQNSCRRHFWAQACLQLKVSSEVYIATNVLRSSAKRNPHRPVQKIFGNNTAGRAQSF